MEGVSVMKQTIKTLVEAYGPPGNESHIRELIMKEITGYVNEIRIDVLGNIIAHKKGSGKGKRIMFAAHMDEIGLIVTHIDDKGFLRFSTMGGIHVHNLIGARVRFASNVMGVIQCENLKSWKDVDIHKLYIDIGAVDKQSAAEKVRVGDACMIEEPMLDLGQRIVAKSLDDRIGCAVAIHIMKELHNLEHDNDVYFVFTVQEEVGLRGAKTAAYDIHPDLGIAIDVTIAGDTPEPPKVDLYLGKGPAIKLKDVSMITSPIVKRLMIETAEKYQIPYQLEVLPYGGTDAGAIHLTKDGILSGCISIPCRYVHSPSEMVDLHDVENAVQLGLKLIEEF